MHLATLWRIVRHTAGYAMLSTGILAAVTAAAPPAKAHGGVSVAIGIGFPGFFAAPVYAAPPVVYAPPPVYYPAPYVAYGPPPPVWHRYRYHRVHHYRRCCCCSY